MEACRLAANRCSVTLILFTGSLLSSDALPLSCRQLDDAEIAEAVGAAFKRSDFVFVGEPVSPGADKRPAEVRVLAYWKGPNLATIPMNRTFWESDERVVFARRSAVGGWRETGPECVIVSSSEMKGILSSFFGHPIHPSPGNREEHELLVAGSIFLFCGFLIVGVWVATRQLSGGNKVGDR